MLQKILSEPDVQAYLDLVKQHQYLLYSHSVGVTTLSLCMGHALGVSDSMLHDIGYGAIFHDAGKLEIPVSILDKNGPLDKEERTLMKTHPICGSKYLPDWLSEISRFIVTQHHETVDGSGYPTGMQDICRAVQIVAVADQYDAMTHKRSYKNEYSPSYVINYLIDCANLGKYDVEVINALSECVNCLQTISNFN